MLRPQALTLVALLPVARVVATAVSLVALVLPELLSPDYWLQVVLKTLLASIKMAWFLNIKPETKRCEPGLLITALQETSAEIFRKQWLVQIFSLV